MRNFYTKRYYASARARKTAEKKKPVRQQKAVRAESAQSKVSLIRNPVQKVVYLTAECVGEKIDMQNYNTQGFAQGDNCVSLLRY